MLGSGPTTLDHPLGTCTLRVSRVQLLEPVRWLPPPLVARPLEEVVASSVLQHARVPQVRQLPPPRQPLALVVLLDVALLAVEVLIMWEPLLRGLQSAQDPTQQVLEVGVEMALLAQAAPKVVRGLRAL